MHSHGPGEYGHTQSAAQAGASRLLLVLVITAAFLIVEVVGGLLTGSLALLADAGHMMTDVAGGAMALLAIKFASRPVSPEKTYGYFRLEMLAAFLNGLLLFGVGGYILFEAYQRFTDPPDVKGLPMLAVAGVGLLVNLAAAYLLFQAQKTSLNMKAAFLEVVSDLLGSAAVIIAGIVILATGFRLIDPIASVFIGLFILPRTWSLVSEAVHVLLEGVPRSVKVDDVKQHILDTPGVVDVHDLHVWSLTSGVEVMSAHVVVQPGVQSQDVLDQLCECLGDHFDIEHSTFQIEQPDRRQLEHSSH